MSSQHAYQHDKSKGGSPELAIYRSFGKLIYFWRENNGYSQQDIVDALNPLLRSRHKPVLARRMYGRLEKDERYPTFYELEPLYRTFVEQLGIAISDMEREHYLTLARKRLEDKQKRRDALTSKDWEQLADTLASIQQRRNLIHLLERNELPPESNDAPVLPLRRVKALADILRTDTSHLLERDPWVHSVLEALAKEPPKKLIVVQAPMGAGKTHALVLLIQRLQEQQQEQEKYILLPYRFASDETKTAEDHFVEFLSTLLSDLRQTPADETKQLPVEQLMEQALAVIRNLSESGKRLIILLDDVQVLFPSPLEWTLDVQTFFTRFVQEAHQAMILCFTRVWPGWPARNLTALAQFDLPELSSQAGRVIWERSGFDDVASELLEQASIRCGGNPQLIEMWAFHQQARQGSAYTWSKAPQLSGGQLDDQAEAAKNPNTRLIEEFLAQDGLFSSRLDIKARQVLSGGISRHLSHTTVRVLECLALSPLGVPFALLEQDFPDLDLAMDELVRASLLDLHLAAAGRASVVPLAREAQMQMLVADGRKAGIEQRVTDLYEYWLTTLQDFRDDSEQAALIAEMIVRYIRQQQLLKAVELMVTYGWLATMFGHILRIQRVVEENTHNQQKEVDSAWQIGSVLLRYQLDLRAGKKIDELEQYQSYQQLRDLADSQQIQLPPAIEAHLAHHLMLVPMRQGQFLEADRVLGETFKKISSLSTFHPEDRAALLYSLSRLQARWGEAEEKRGNEEEAIRLREACIKTLKECVELWKTCYVGALPLQRKFVDYRLARALNDYAYRLRLSGHLDDAEHSINECLILKRAGAALPKSLATSLSEHSQILKFRGKIREALAQNDQALHILNDLIEQGTNVRADKGMIMVERGDIYVMQGRLTEAEQCFVEGRDLSAEKKARKAFFDQAVARLDWIAAQQQRFGNHYQLDKIWFDRYQALVAFDDIEWLLQGGPFTSDEQHEWQFLVAQKRDEKTKQRMSELLIKSREREFALCREEEREPHLCYPMIPLLEIEDRLKNFHILRQEIAETEANVIVRNLYLDVIDEIICLLQMFQAIAAADTEGFQRLNETLYGRIALPEMRVALQALFAMLERAHGHNLAGPVAKKILLQLKQWHILPVDFAPSSNIVTPQPSRKRMPEGKREFSAPTVQRFFQNLFSEMGVNAIVRIEPARSNTYVDVDMGLLALPDRLFPTEKFRQLLAEEFETHFQRSLSGRNSPLALLGSGLAKYSATDEGLAKIYIEQVNSFVYGKTTINSWPGTLAAGLLSGVVSAPLTFRQLCAFLEQVFLVRQLLTNKYESIDAAIEPARTDAWKRAARTVRGVPDLTVPGICSFKDRIYLQGYLEVGEYLEQGKDIQQLYVGKIGIQHVDAMQELHILRPALPHMQLALDPALQEHLAAFDGV